MAEVKQKQKKKKISFDISPDVWKELKVRCAQYNTTMSDVVEQSIRGWLKPHPAPQHQVSVQVDAISATSIAVATPPVVTILDKIDALPDKELKFAPVLDCDRLCHECKNTVCLYPDYLKKYYTTTVDATSASENTRVII